MWKIFFPFYFIYLFLVPWPVIKPIILSHWNNTPATELPSQDLFSPILEYNNCKNSWEYYCFQIRNPRSIKTLGKALFLQFNFFLQFEALVLCSFLKFEVERKLNHWRWEFLIGFLTDHLYHLKYAIWERKTLHIRF